MRAPIIIVAVAAGLLFLIGLPSPNDDTPAAASQPVELPVASWSLVNRPPPLPTG